MPHPNVSKLCSGLLVGCCPLQKYIQPVPSNCAQREYLGLRARFKCLVSVPCVSAGDASAKDENEGTTQIMLVDFKPPNPCPSSSLPTSLISSLLSQPYKTVRYWAEACRSLLRLQHHYPCRMVLQSWLLVQRLRI